MEHLTAERARELLDYDPLTGVLTWRVTWRKRRAGREVGGASSCGYRRVGIGGRRHLSHRVAWLMVHGEFPSGQIDHINGIRSDNRLQNLRVVPKFGNDQNRAVRRSNASGVTGVHFDNRRGKWNAEITLNGTRYYLGGFATVELAAAAYASAKRRLHDYCPEPVSRQAIPVMAHVEAAATRGRI